MDTVHRLPPSVEFYEVVKYLDPRLLQIQFYKNEHMFCSSPVAHDKSGNLIFDRIRKNGTVYYLLLSQEQEPNGGSHSYYLTFVEEKGLTSVFAGKNMESAVFQYLEQVADFRI